MSERLAETRKLVRLRERRADTALSAVYAAQAAVGKAQAALTRRDAAIVAHDRSREALDQWIAGDGVDGLQVQGALLRREAIARAKAADEKARLEDVKLVAAAETLRAQALAALARAQARRDAADLSLKTEEGALSRRLERAAEMEFEERGGPARGAFA